MNGKLCIAIIGVLVTVGVASSASISNEESLPKDVTCSSNDNFVQYDPDSCSMYYECDNGDLKHKSCGVFYKFDEKSNKCKFFWWLFGSADCSLVNGNGGGGSTTTTTPGGPTSGTSKPTDSPNNPTTTTAKPSSATSNSISAMLGMILLAANRVIV